MPSLLAPGGISALVLKGKVDVVLFSYIADGKRCAVLYTVMRKAFFDTIIEA